jgi:Xaa-Pro aminopeptidase
MLIWAWLLPLTSQAQSLSFSPAFYAENRTNFLNLLPDSSIALFFSADESHFQNDLYYPYRQESSLFYLTGLKEKQALLLLAKPAIDLQGEMVSEILFLKPGTEKDLKWHGKSLEPKEAEERCGFQKSLPDSLFKNLVTDELKKAGTPFGSLWLTQPRLAYRYPEMISNAQRAFETHCLQQKIQVKNSHQLITRLRARKRPKELQAIRKAVESSIQGHLASIKACQPGMKEDQLAALAVYTFSRQGCSKPAYAPIVGSGPNSLILHHWSGRRKIQAEDLVIMDLGASCMGYASDLTRTVPGDGVFSPAQKVIYNIVLKAQARAIEACRAGKSLIDVHHAAKSTLAIELLELGILSDTLEISRYMWHFTCHHVGLDVHDSYYTVLEEDMVLAIEPGLYIRPGSPCPKRFWGLAVRVEDMVKVTTNKPEILSRRLPKSPEAIEILMQQGRTMAR